MQGCGLVNRLYFLEQCVFTGKLSGTYRAALSITLPHTLPRINILFRSGTSLKSRSQCYYSPSLMAHCHQVLPFPEWHEVDSNSLQPLRIGYFHLKTGT